MATDFQPPPTWAEVILVDKAGKAPPKFNPVWLKWFVDLVGVINASGGGGGTIQHNDLGGLQGGTANQYYHLTAAESTLLIGGGTANQVLHGAGPSWGAVTEGDLSLSDVATADVSIAKHGFAPKAPNDTTKFLRGDASWAVPPASTPGLVLLDTQTASGSATLDFTTGLNSTYETYLFDIEDLVPATDDVGLWMRVSLDGGASWKSGGSDYSWASVVYATSAVGNNDSADSEIELVPATLAANQAIGNASGEGFSGMVRLQNPAGTARFKLLSSMGANYVNASGNPTSVLGSSGMYVAATSAINGIRFLTESGNISSGTIRLYGVTK